MRRNQRPLKFLIIALISFFLALFVIIFVSPTQPVNLGITHLSPLILFFIPVVIFFFSLPAFLLKSKKHGVLVSLFVLSYLMFRLSGLTHPIFLVLLLGLFLTLELLFSNRQPS